MEDLDERSSILVESALALAESMGGVACTSKEARDTAPVIV